MNTTDNIVKMSSVKLVIQQKLQQMTTGELLLIYIKLNMIINSTEKCPQNKTEFIKFLLIPFKRKYKMESTSFSAYKKKYLDQLNEEKKYLQRLLKNKEKNLKKIISEKKSQWFVDKGNKEIEERQIKIMNIQNEIESIKLGKNNDQLEKMYSQQTKELKNKEIKGKAKIMKKVKKYKQKDKAYHQDIKKTRTIRKEKKDEKRYIKQAYRHFQRVNLPKYLQEKLKKMSGNRGIVYKSIHYYGHLPEKKYESIILTERKPDGTFLTHEYTDTEYIIHSKKNGKQKVISRKLLKVPAPERKRKVKKKRYYKKKTK